MIIFSSASKLLKNSLLNLKESSSERPQRVSSNDTGTVSLAKSFIATKRKTMRGTKTCIVWWEFSSNLRKRSTLKGQLILSFTLSRSYFLSIKSECFTAETEMIEAGG
jgi:hypothetical protein